jgi:hypothetical protein
VLFKEFGPVPMLKTTDRRSRIVSNGVSAHSMKPELSNTKSSWIAAAMGNHR